ncbi:MAG: phosphoribosylformylglycinamidine synthase subunit PurS [Firmicutes bacterium]|nr:phosphoribosylformylglycinamidine synthase subunit PurS [Bacillota bacterium]
MWRAEIKVLLKKSVLDPQGRAVENALASLGYANVNRVRIGKYLEVTIATPDRAAAEAQVREMCARLLTNPVIEDYTFTLVEVEA